MNDEQRRLNLNSQSTSEYVETRRAGTAAKSIEEPKSSVEEPRPLLEATQRQAIRNYIDAYKSEIVDSSSIEIDEAEVQRITERYQEMIVYKNTMENTGKAYWKDGFQVIEGLDEVKIDAQPKSQREDRRTDSPRTSRERVETKRSVGIPRVSPAKSKNSNASPLSEKMQAADASSIRKIKPGRSRPASRSKSPALQKARKSPASDVRRSPARSSDSGQLLQSLPKKRSVQQMIKDHRKQ